MSFYYLYLLFLNNQLTHPLSSFAIFVVFSSKLSVISPFPYGEFPNQSPSRHSDSPRRIQKVQSTMTVQLTSIPSSIPVQTRSTPTASSLRSPKRVKQTPTYSAGSSSSSTPNTTYNKPPRNRAIFTVPKRIIVEEDRQQPTYYATSPCRSSEENWSNPGRRREMSVPLVSHRRGMD